MVGEDSSARTPKGLLLRCRHVVVIDNDEGLEQNLRSDTTKVPDRTRNITVAVACWLAAVFLVPAAGFAPLAALAWAAAASPVAGAFAQYAAVAVADQAHSLPVQSLQAQARG
jgi:p-aminobenzoyl-glutamate transporter AbgT